VIRGLPGRKEVPLRLLTWVRGTTERQPDMGLSLINTEELTGMA
jgi:hypothetical protein